MKATEAEPNTSLHRELGEARALTDSLFAMVSPAAFQLRPIPERHRIIFYLGHLEAFDWNQICRSGLSLGPCHEELDRLFAFGIDPPIGQLPQDKPDDWPTLEATLDYRKHVRQQIDRILDVAPKHCLHIALEHRLMHAETFAYMLHNVALEYKSPPHAPSPVLTDERVAPSWIEIPAGEATLGTSRSGGFGWDNEFEEHRLAVPAFSIARYKVTNGEYLEFVEAGAEPPYFWRVDGSTRRLRTMFGEIPLPMNWPAWVTHEEAAAYARWRGKSLLAEAQFHRAAYATPEGTERAYPWGAEPPNATLGNFDSHHWDPIPVHGTPAGDSAWGVAQLVGNGWEWTSTVFGPFEGFEPSPSYPGYSADFFDGEHYVLKGGSSRTAAALLRRSFRNWFRPNYPYLFAGFRLVEN